MDKALEDIVIADTRRWLERAVIGLNLCPFAKGVAARDQIHFAVSAATDARDVLLDLKRALTELAAAPPEGRDTTLLMLPCAMEDFLAFNDFLEDADALVEELGLAGALQVAPFHPRFQFADTAEDEASNNTNRSPYPTLHLLREDSISRAVEQFPEAEEIFERNIEVMEQLGAAGWEALDVGARCPLHGASPRERK